MQSDQKPVSKPRVTCEHQVSSITMGQFGGGSFRTPEVRVSVEFDAGDAETALRELEYAVERVRAQIALAP